MAGEILSVPMTPAARLAPVESRYAPQFCLALLVAGSALASFAFACITPFAAFAVVAAGMLPLRSALAVVAATWLVNQGIGFGVLGYPLDGHTLAWGAVIGMAALLATAASSLVLWALSRLAVVTALALALLAAFAADQAVLAAATSVLGGAGDVTVPVIAHVGMLSMIWLVGLVTACDVTSLLTAERRPQLSA